MLMNVGDKPVFSKNGLLTTVAWGKNGEVKYALEGSVFVAGAAIQWLRDEMCLVKTAQETEALASSVEDTNGVYFVPAFVGLGAPYWDPYARGIIIGLTRGANRNHIVRATLESLGYQTKDLADAMIADCGGEIPSLKVDGGAAANNFILQFQADILNCQVIRPMCIETTSLGAAYLAGLATGYWKDEEDILSNMKIDCIFEPSMDDKKRNELLSDWKKAVCRSKSWIE